MSEKSNINHTIINNLKQDKKRAHIVSIPEITYQQLYDNLHIHLLARFGHKDSFILNGLDIKLTVYVIIN